ncbi:substance-P receptor-like [Glandiceps talaboti]
MPTLTDETTNGNFATNASPCIANRFAQPPYIIFTWAAIYGAVIIVAAGGNCIVMWIVLAHREMRTVTNYFLVNLAFADTLFVLFYTPFQFTYLIGNIWYFGNAYCKISQFIGPLTVSASIFTLAAISIDRYIAIVHPMRPRMTKLEASMIIVVVWVVAVLTLLPILIYAQTYVFNCTDGQKTICILIWPDDVYQDYDFWYHVGRLVITYFVPLVAMAVSYTIVGIKLWGSQTPGECSHRHREQLRAKRKVVKMMIFVLLVFAICWLPLHIYLLLARHHRHLYQWKHMPHVYMGIFWLAMSNSMYNPFIYCWMNDRFRRGFRRALRFFPCVKRKPLRKIMRPSTISGSTHSSKLSRNGSIETTTEHHHPGMETAMKIHVITQEKIMSLDDSAYGFLLFPCRQLSQIEEDITHPTVEIWLRVAVQLQSYVNSNRENLWGIISFIALINYLSSFQLDDDEYTLLSIGENYNEDSPAASPSNSVYVEYKCKTAKTRKKSNLKKSADSNLAGMQVFAKVAVIYILVVQIFLSNGFQLGDNHTGAMVQKKRSVLIQHWLQDSLLKWLEQRKSVLLQADQEQENENDSIRVNAIDKIMKTSKEQRERNARKRRPPWRPCTLGHFCSSRRKGRVNVKG